MKFFGGFLRRNGYVGQNLVWEGERMGRMPTCPKESLRIKWLVTRMMSRCTDQRKLFR